MVCALHARQTIWVGLRQYLAEHGHKPTFTSVLGMLSTPAIYGAIAVPLFFVISGYCIHRSFALKLNANSDHAPHWGNYLIRRAWRIYPVLVAAMGLTWWLDPYTLERFPADAALGDLSWTTALSNLLALQGVASPPYGSDRPLWSLSIELQLYALYPFIFYATRKWGIKICLGLTLAVSLAGVALSLTPGLASLVWFGPFWFCWTLGAAIAEIETGRCRFQLRLGGWIIWSAISLIGFVLWFGKLNIFAFSCIGCFWALLVLRGLRRPASGLRFLPLGPMSKLGLVSYSLYAIHQPLCLFARSVFLHGVKTDNILLVPVVMAACVVAAAVLFFLVERRSLTPPKWWLVKDPVA